MEGNKVAIFVTDWSQEYCTLKEFAVALKKVKLSKHHAECKLLIPAAEAWRRPYALAHTQIVVQRFLSEEKQVIRYLLVDLFFSKKKVVHHGIESLTNLRGLHCMV